MSPLSADSSDEWLLVALTPYGRLIIWAALAAALASVTLVWIASRHFGARRRVALVALRLGAALAALVLFVQPAMRLQNVTRLPNHVAVVVDDSASMALAEAPGKPSRAARARAFLRAQTAELARLAAAGHRVDYYTFADKLEPTTLAALTAEPAAAEPARTKDATLFHEALTALRARYDGADLGGAVVISDGIDTGRWSAAALDSADRDLLKAFDAPIHTVWTGEPGLTDVAVTRVLADDFAFVRTALRVDAVIRVLNPRALDGKVLPITLARDGVPLQSISVRVESGKSEYRISFPFTPDRVGRYVYEIAVPPQPGEAIVENNTRRFLIKVIRDKIRVLLVAGRPSWDERFLRELWKHDPNVDLISFFILRTPDDVEAVSSDELSLIPFPTDELFQHELRSFDAVFFQNFNFGPYGIGTYLGEVQKYVEEGGGLAMLGGDLSFSSGGYAGTPIASVLPVELADPGARASAGLHDPLIDPTPFHLQLSDEGKRHPITALRVEIEENTARWHALPELGGTNLVARAKPGATVLAVHPTRKDQDGRPLPILTVGEAGKGRALALTTDSSWRWVFSGGAVCEGASCADRARVYQRFWENAVRWLIRDPSLSLLRIDARNQAWKRHERVVLRVRSLKPDYQPSPGTEIRLEVTRLPSAADTSAAPSSVHGDHQTSDEGGDASFDLGPLPPGGYRATARATLAGRDVSEDAVFLVEGAGRELEEPEARKDLLAALSTATDGRALALDDTLDGLRFRTPAAARINRHRDVELWSGWWVLLAAASCLSLEWLLRRRWGRL